MTTSRLPFAFSLLLLFLVNANGQPVQIIPQSGHRLKITDLAFTPDGKSLITCSDDQTLSWDIKTGFHFSPLEIGGLFCLAISPDGQYLAGFRDIDGGYLRAKLLVARLPEGKVIWEKAFEFREDRETKRAYGLSFTNDSRQILSVTHNEYQLWEVESGRQLAGNAIDLIYDNNYDKNYLKNIIHPTLSPDNSQFAVITNDCEVGVYQTLSGKQIQFLNKKQDKNRLTSINALIFLNTHELVAAASDNGRLKVSWDTRSGNAQVYGAPSLPRYSVLNSQVMLGINFDSLSVLDLNTMKTRLKTAWTDKTFGGEHHLFALSPASDFAAVYYANKKQLQLYSLISGSLIKKIAIFNPVPVNNLSFSKTGNLIFQTGVRDYGRFDRLWYYNLHVFGDPVLLSEVHDDTLNYHLGSNDQIFDPEGQFLFYVDDCSWSDKKLYAKPLDYPDQKDQALLDLPSRESNFELKVSPDGRWLDIQHAGFWDLQEKKLLSKAEQSIYLFSDSRSGSVPPLKIKQKNYLSPGPGLDNFFCLCGRMMYDAVAEGNLQIQEVAPGVLQLNCPHENRDNRKVDARYFPAKQLLVVNREEHAGRPNDLVILDLQNWKALANTRHQSLKNGFFASTDPPVIISHEPGKAFFWDPLSGRLLDSLTHLSPQSNALGLSKDHRLLAVSTLDGSIELWNWRQKKKEATILTSEENGYLIFTPDGYYATNKNSGRVCFKINRELYPLEVFDINFNRPDIIIERMGFADAQTLLQHQKIVQKRLQKMGIALEGTPQITSLPQLELISEMPSFETTQRQLSLHIQAKDEQVSLAFVQILVNEVPLFGQRGYQIAKSDIREFRQRFDLELSEGKNVIQIYVINQQGLSSPWKTLEIHYIGPRASPDLHLVAVGVSRYQDARMNLSYARKDAEDVVRLFQSRPGSFQKIHTYEFYDETVNRQNFLNLREQLLKTRSQDKVVIFIAGHGLRDKNLDYYLATYDTDFGRPETKGIAFEQIEALLDGIPARRKVIFMDACYSGEADKEDMERVQTNKTKEGTVTFRSFGPGAVQKKNEQVSFFDLMKEQFVDLRRNSGSVVISAAGGAEFAMESEAYSNGVFTFSLLSGLTELVPARYEKYEAHLLADFNADHRVTVSELRRYLFEKVPELTQGRQRPTTRVDYLYNDFVLWEYNPGQSLRVKPQGSSDFEFTTAEELEQLLNSGLSINEKDNNGATVLMYSLYVLNDIKWLRRLVEMGADPYQKGTIRFKSGSGDSYYGSLLAIAAAQGHLEATRYLIENCRIPVDDKEYDAESKSETGWTALQWAANNGHTEIVDYLLQKGAAINIAIRNAGDTPLRLASQNGHLSTVNLLLSKGADPQIESEKGWNALHFAARFGQTAIIPFLIRGGLSVNGQISEGWTPGMLAAINKHYTCFAEILRWNPNLELKNKEGKTLMDLAREYQLWAIQEIINYRGSERELFYKIKELDQQAVLKLLANGADINATDDYGANMFAHIVWEFQDLEMIKAVVNYQPDLNMKGIIWETEPGKGFYGNLQGLAVGTGKLEILRYFTEDLGLPVDEKEYTPETRAETGWTALQWACSKKNQEMAGYLLQAGANLNVGETTHDTPLLLYFLRKAKWDDKDQELIRQMIASSRNINVTTTDGWTALHLLSYMENRAYHGSVVADYAARIIKKGAAINAKTDQGWTPLMLAAKSGATPVCQKLLEAGADCSPVDEEGKNALELAAARRDAALYQLLAKSCGK